ncbi:hypothetical protein B2D07_18580 [Desulfococcus multivorans]|uniref:IstB domain protein ATP-binding protein n=1 Tax=Desulfococcus multivorans DSM 2059 TaxID=1121405 RepID=S7T7M0_DESML|nr:ATP-binding protein [Desulfococcus multivorans]AOY60486.1 IstB-like ATP-binding protein, transposase IS21 family [Desulfococcus multivorans]AQV02581.1 hypothetical protein B2D07_18580 [Desulfococcus multivorans]EPR32505.1 IstB domain protein ATP-binding protein [Desulfococcus multivorans DSM 2059]SKA27713.1 IstB-like ATP binding protein [Desulfococcus multivorans DSM 2059]
MDPDDNTLVKNLKVLKLCFIGENTLTTARTAGRQKDELKKYVKPDLLIDELGYLPVDNHGADLLFPIISQGLARDLQQRQHPHVGAL